MKPRSGPYPSKTLFEVEKFAVAVFQNVGETVLKYNDLAKHGNVAVREADSFAATAGQYGWLEKSYGKGYSAISSVCTSLKTPYDNAEKNKLYLQAFQSPPLYKLLIPELNGKKTTEEGLKITLIRNHGFTDAGAKVASKVFIENAKFLGLINSDDVFSIEGDIIVDLNAIQQKQTSKKKNDPKSPKKDGVKQKAQHQPANAATQHSGGVGLKKIPIFVRGQELSFPVFEDMNNADWDAVVKQILNIKAFSRG